MFFPVPDFTNPPPSWTFGSVQILKSLSPPFFPWFSMRFTLSFLPCGPFFFGMSFFVTFFRDPGARSNYDLLSGFVVPPSAPFQSPTPPPLFILHPFLRNLRVLLPTTFFCGYFSQWQFTLPYWFFFPRKSRAPSQVLSLSLYFELGVPQMKKKFRFL